MKKEWLLNAATVVMAVCALVVTGLVVRREFFPPGAAAMRPRSVPEWRSFAAVGQRMGPQGAPVTITEFSDFQCPFCRVLAERLKDVRGRYPGQVAVVYRHFPLPSHDYAVAAARASECAGAQGRFEAFHDALYAAQADIGKRPWTSFAAEAQVPDTAAFARCAAQKGRLPVVDRDMEAGRKLKVAGTPTLLINGMRLQGAVPADTLDAFIQRALMARTGEPVQVRVGAR